MEEPKINIKTVAIDSLEYDPLNVRKHDERNIDAIKASLSRFGQQKPIVVKKDGTVIAGNGTLGAMRMLGYKEVVIAETELDGEEAVAYAIADNRTAELASWDEQALAEALDQLNDELLPASGFNENELGELVAEFTMPETEALSKDLKLPLFYEPEHIDGLTLSDCLNFDKYNAKVEAIEQSNLTQPQRETMIWFAMRFIAIDFQRVADYYGTHATEDERAIIERLRLVLVDNDVGGLIEDDLLRIADVT